MLAPHQKFIKDLNRIGITKSKLAYLTCFNRWRIIRMEQVDSSHYISDAREVADELYKRLWDRRPVSVDAGLEADWFNVIEEFNRALTLFSARSLLARREISHVILYRYFREFGGDPHTAFFATRVKYGQLIGEALDEAYDDLIRVLNAFWSSFL